MAGERIHVLVDDGTELDLDCDGNLGGEWTATGSATANNWRSDDVHGLTIVGGSLGNQRATARLQAGGGRVTVTSVTSFRW